MISLYIFFHLQYKVMSLTSTLFGIIGSVLIYAPRFLLSSEYSMDVEITIKIPNQLLMVTVHINQRNLIGL